MGSGALWNSTQNGMAMEFRTCAMEVLQRSVGTSGQQTWPAWTASGRDWRGGGGRRAVAQHLCLKDLNPGINLATGGQWQTGRSATVRMPGMPWQRIQHSWSWDSTSLSPLRLLLPIPWSTGNGMLPSGPTSLVCPWQVFYPALSPVFRTSGAVITWQTFSRVIRNKLNME